MKSVLLPLILFGFALQLNAQISIDRSDYTLEIGDTIFLWNADNPEVVPLPQLGENQVWDYTAINFNTNAPWHFTHPSGTDPDYPEANVINHNNIAGVLPGLFFDVTFLSVIDEQGLSTLGRKQEPAKVSLESMTGNSADSINFTKTDNYYEDPSIQSKFPMNFNDSDTSHLILHNNFELTIAAYGLDHVPGDASYVTTVIRDTKGWGTLKFTDPESGNTIETEVLLVESTTIKVDTFTLGGAAAPGALLSAFGLQQGKVSTDVEYTFWTKGFNSEILIIERDDDGSQYARINRDAASIISSDRKVAREMLAMKVYPNPTYDRFYLDFEKTSSKPWTASLYNALGQQVATQRIEDGRGQIHQEFIFPGISGGMYQVVIRNEAGVIVGQNKIVRL